MTEEKQKQAVRKISKHEFYFETPLYDQILVKDLEENFFSGDVDGYSNTLQDNTTYSIEFNWIDIVDEKYQQYRDDLKKGFAEITLTCKRKNNDVLRFFVWNNEINDDGILMKVGQFPSVADLEFEKLQKKYEKVLDKKYLKEFKRAVGLSAHGIGVGSFVYLRRIFENLIFQTFESNKEKIEIEGKEFKTKRMEDKIDILKSFLPSQLVKMKSIYGILSKGIHKLDDKVCLTYFSPLKLSIELILDQKIEEKKKADRDKLVEQEIKDIQQKLK